jgi:hypothetical protein
LAQIKKKCVIIVATKLKDATNVLKGTKKNGKRNINMYDKEGGTTNVEKMVFWLVPFLKVA